jgi:inosine-uridine nucleoside N-ribohydrolase
MASKLILLSDPGIDGAFAITLGLLDPDLDVLGLAASAGNVTAEQATRNMQIVVEQIDPPRLPRIGAALPVEYDGDGTRLHGQRGLGNTTFPCSELHHAHSADKLIADLARQNPKEVTVVAMGPLTGLAAALDREPELPSLLKRIVCVGGTWQEPGNAGPCSEFHFFCDPPAARKVIRSGAPISVVPLDVSRKLLFSPADLLELPSPESRACRFLRQIVPFGIGATSNIYGIEGFHLKDVMGIAAVVLPQALTTKPMAADVEVRGDITRGMCVFDQRRNRTPTLNVELVTDVEVSAVRDYLRRVLAQAA